jgi:pSer/pThr/pTyr-binding forkhead associated (FHA) protein
MGALESPDGARHELSADHLIGRGPDASLLLAHDSASRRHATLRWTGRQWELLDLGSLNGSFVDDTRVASGGRVSLQVGSRLRFGESEAQWLLIDDGPPGASVVALDTGRRITPTGGIIAVPDAGEPQLSVYQTGDGSWLAETSERAWSLSNNEAIVIGGISYRFEAGQAVAITRHAGFGAAPALDRIALELSVSRNEEQVDITIVHRGERTTLRSRAHSYVLLTLARLRLEDQAKAELPESSHGWVDQDQLVTMLATTRSRLALDVYRARAQFADAGIADAAMIVERRTSSRELRIGVSKLAVQLV